MADSKVADPIPSNPDDFDPLPIPPLDSAFFSDIGQSFDGDFDDLDFTFDDIYLPSDTEEFFNSLPVPVDPPSALDSFVLSTDQISNDPRVSNSCGSDQLSAYQSAFQVSGDRSSDVANFLNVSSPESSQESGNKVSDVSKVFSYPSPVQESSQGSGNSVSAVSSPNSANNSTNGVVDQKIKVEEEGNNCMLKRKKESENVDPELRTSKYRRSNADGFNGSSEEDEKKQARLMRNRESAQLSRQRKKHYVEELEDKVRAMHSTIQDLNSKISYIVAENATLRQQVSGGGAMCPPPGMYPHPPIPPMGYPWMPCPPYVVKPQGSQVPLVPIPRLKPQQPAPAPKAKKVESKKTEGKTKKVASVSFLGLLFFILLFGGLVPMVNVKFRDMHESVSGRLEYFNNRFYDQQRGRVLTSVKDHLNGSDHDMGFGLSNGRSCNGNDFMKTGHCGKNHVGGAKSNVEQGGGNYSEPLVASLYVPRNDKLVKIDGNLIIHSVLASEKAMASYQDRGMESSEEETGLAVHMPTIIPLTGRNNGRHPQPYRGPSERQRALGVGDKDNLKSTVADGKLQQWFREGLAGPLLSSGMCTEVFQFDVSPSPGAIVPATTVMKNSSERHHPQNATHLVKGRNRRILQGVSVPLGSSEINITEQHMGKNPEKDNLRGNNSVSSMVVSVLFDPRETGDGDGVMGPKSLSRIFVVVLIDSVKYVTYSCMLPLKGSVAHL